MSYSLPFVTQEEEDDYPLTMAHAAVPNRSIQPTPKTPNSNATNFWGNIPPAPKVKSTSVRSFARKDGTQVKSHRRTIKKGRYSPPINVSNKTRPRSKLQKTTKRNATPKPNFNTWGSYSETDFIGVDPEVKALAISIRINEMKELVTPAKK